MCSRPARKGRLAATVTPSHARPSGARSPYCGGGGEQRRVIEEEDVAGALVDAAVRGVAGVVVKLTPGDVVAMGECCEELFLRFTEVLRAREEAAVVVVAHKARGWRSRGGGLATAWCVEARRRRRLGFTVVALVRECQAVSVQRGVDAPSENSCRHSCWHR